MLLSIVIPVYNVETYIRKCLESIVHLPLEIGEYEIIVINDGTPDHSMDIVHEYDSLPYLHIVNQPNKGLSGARNTGLNKAKGEWVYFLDSDDYVSDQLFTELFLKASNRDDVDVIVGNYNYVINNEPFDGKYAINTKEDIVLSGSDFLVKYYSKVNSMVWRSFYRKSMLLDNVLFFTEGVYHEDINWTPKCIAAANKVYYAPIPFYYYLIREGSIVQSSRNNKKICDLLFVYGDLLKHFSTHKEEVQEFISYSTITSLFVLNGQYGIYKNKELYKRYIEVIGIQCARNIKTRVLYGIYRLIPGLFNKVLSLRYAAKDTKNVF